MKKLILFILFLLAYAVSAFGGEYRRIGEDYRAKAMGNTGIVTATASNAIFFNPAAMSNVFSWWWDAANLEVTYNTDSRDLVDTVMNGNFSLDTQEEQFAFMDDFIGKNPYVKVSSGTNFVFNVSKRGFTIGANYTYEIILDIKVTNPSMPEIELFSRVDHVRQYGFSMPFMNGQLVLGAVSKTIERNEVDATYGISQALENVAFPDTILSGLGAGYDLGFIYRAGTKSRISYGGVYRKGIELGDATAIPEEYAFGMGMMHEWGIFRWMGAVDFRDLTFKAGSEGDKSINRRTHWGSELGIFSLSPTRSMISIRNGFSQGGFSTGAEIALWRFLILGGTRYIETTGEYASQSPQNRTVMYVSLGF